MTVSLTKQCSKCGLVKDITAFTKSKRGIYGTRPECKDCEKVYRKLIAHSTKMRMKSYRSIPEVRAKQLFRNAKDRAIKNSIPFTLTMKRIENALSFGKCERTGIKFEFNQKENQFFNPYSPSVDKVDPTKGYTDDNVKIVVDIYNRGKGQNTDEEFRDFILKAAEYLS